MCSFENNNYEAISGRTVKHFSDLTELFREARKELQDNCGEGGRSIYPLELVAELLNAPKETLRKRINGQKKLDRDWLIAICAAHGLGATYTVDDNIIANDALEMMSYPLLDDGIEREKIICEFLDRHVNNPVHISELNDRLIKHGFKPLTGNLKNTNNKSHIEELYSRIIRTHKVFDQYDSISSRYYPLHICTVETMVKDKNSRNTYILTASSDKKFKIRKPNETLGKTISDIAETGEFEPVFSSLLKEAKKEEKKINSIINDTKNYRFRYGADLVNEKIRVFCEEYNYSIPENNEYFLMEYSNGKFSFSVANKSMFMQEYLTPEKYYELYHTNVRIPRITYSSTEEITQAYSKKGIYSDYYQIGNYYKKAFEKLAQSVMEIFSDICNRKTFINNFNYVFDYPFEVIRYYDVCDEFKAKMEENEYGDIEVTEFQKLAVVNNTTITFDDLKRAFELGYKDKNQICSIKCKYGSIESVLN